MRNQKAQRLARWSAAIALLVAASVAGVYLHRAYLARRERASAPPALPASVEEHSAGFSFSKVEGDRTIYTVRAANATQFKDGNRNLLEDVWITSYGQQGDRNDTLRTKSCDYVSASSSAAGSASSSSSAGSVGTMVCAGDVEIDLESASDAKTNPSAANGEPSPAAHILHVSTSNLSFEQDSGVASTDHAVKFRFPGGTGKALGLRFDSQQGELNLAHDVEIVMQPQGPPAAQAAPPTEATQPANSTGSPIVIRGQSMVYSHTDGIAHLRGPAEIQDGASTLTAQAIALALDENFHAQRAVASGQPELRQADPLRQIATSANEFTALFTPSGSIGRIIGAGNVRATSQGRGQQDEFDAAHVEIEMTPATGQPRFLTASGGTKGTAHVGNTTRTFSTAALEMNFTQPAAHHGSAQLELVHTLAPATAEWIAPADANAAASHASAAPAAAPMQTTMQTTRMSGQTLDLHFAPDKQIDRLTGIGGVEIDQDLGAAGTRASTSQNLDAHFDNAGDWTTLEQSGRVHYRDAQGTAESDHAHLDHATNTTTLAGSVVLTDPNSRTTAETATFAQDTNVLHAEGRVITAELANAARPAANFSDQPARVSADHLVTERAAGHATYTGHARLWQGDSVMQADSIELDHPAQTVTALGHVRAVFPAAAWTPAQPTQADAKPAGSAPTQKTAAQKSPPQKASSSAKPAAASAAAPQPEDLWHAQGDRLTYWSQKSLGRLEGNASADSQEASIRAPTIDFLFAPTDANNPSGQKQLVQTIATGGVSVRQLDRRGTSQRADYTVADRKFVLSGGPPVLRDDSGNSTTGRQLTFIFADDTIVVDSEEGTRTLTLHRVEK
jgi:lipopolysaccharide export system protein LptA